MGPVPLLTQIPIIHHHIEDALARGARATLGGLDSTQDRYVTPTVLVDVDPDALVVTEETFGPVLAVVRVADADVAVELVNRSRYGLGGSVFSRVHGVEIAQRLRTGMTSVNDALMGLFTDEGVGGV